MIFDLLKQFQAVIPTQELHRKVFIEIQAAAGTMPVGLIAERINKSATEVSTAIRKLQTAGFIRLSVRNGQFKYYEIHPDLERKIAALKTFLEPSQPE